MIADSRQYLELAPWASAIPGVAIVLVVLAFNFVGDELRDAADPRNTVFAEAIGSSPQDTMVFPELTQRDETESALSIREDRSST